MNIRGPILIVENDPDDHHLLQSAFKDIGITNELIFFKNGLEALDYLLNTKEKPFIILCDLNMPVMGGLQLRHNINENETLRRKSIPFIFYSTTALEEDVIKAYEMCVQGFFEKHYSYAELCTDLQRICDYWTNCIQPPGY